MSSLTGLRPALAANESKLDECHQKVADASAPVHRVCVLVSHLSQDTARRVGGDAGARQTAWIH